MVSLLCCTVLLLKQYRWALQNITFFVLYFLWAVGPTIKPRIKELFTLVTSTGPSREKHSQLSFATELAQSGVVSG